jgi:hypothetical protein
MKCSSLLSVIVGVGLLLGSGANAYADPIITNAGSIDVTWFPGNFSRGATIDLDNSTSSIKNFAATVSGIQFTFATDQTVDVSSAMVTITAASEGHGVYGQLTIAAPKGVVFNRVKLGIVLASGIGSVESSGSNGASATIIGLESGLQQVVVATGDFNSITITSRNGIYQIKDIEISSINTSDFDRRKGYAKPNL